MSITQKTAIVVPCYNEALRLQSREFGKLASENLNLHFIFVNDGSTDETERRLLDLSHSNPVQIHFISLERNCGKAEAVRRGFLKAFGMDCVYIGFWDADLATPLRMISRFCELLESPGTAIAIGARVRLLGRRIKRRGMRHFMGRLFANCASVVLKVAIYDTQCGAKIFKDSDELRIVFGSPFWVKWIFDVEIIARFILTRKFMDLPPIEESCVEYPLEEWADVSGSKLRSIDFVIASLELLKILFFLRAPGTKERFRKLYESILGKARN